MLLTYEVPVFIQGRKIYLNCYYYDAYEFGDQDVVEAALGSAVQIPFCMPYSLVTSIFTFPVPSVDQVWYQEAILGLPSLPSDLYVAVLRDATIPNDEASEFGQDALYYWDKRMSFDSFIKYVDSRYKIEKDPHILLTLVRRVYSTSQ